MEGPGPNIGSSRLLIIMGLRYTRGSGPRRPAWPSRAPKGSYKWLKTSVARSCYEIGSAPDGASQPFPVRRRRILRPPAPQKPSGHEIARFRKGPSYRTVRTVTPVAQPVLFIGQEFLEKGFLVVFHEEKSPDPDLPKDRSKGNASTSLWGHHSGSPHDAIRPRYARRTDVGPNLRIGCRAALLFGKLLQHGRR
jgi:hypothetical protein